MKSLPALLVTLAAAGVSTGCYLNSSGRALEQQLNLLEARHNEFATTFEQDRAQLAEVLTRAEAQIRELEGALADAQAFLQRNSADIGARVDAQVAEVNALRGRIEEAMHQAQQLRDAMDLMRQEFDIRFQAMQR
jgi:predicted RNase H-like nuclease (RuvC/YqgF family)